MIGSIVPMAAGGPHAHVDASRVIIRGLPALPSVVRYLDEYDDEIRSIRTGDDIWEFRYDTEALSLNFNKFDDNDVIFVAKHFFSFVTSKLSPVSIEFVYGGLCTWAIPEDTVLRCVYLHPHEFQQFWNSTVIKLKDPRVATAVKWFMRFMCEMSIGHCRPSHADLVTALPFDWNDNYLGVASGKSIITVAQERAIIRHLDGVASTLPTDVSDEVLTKACLLCISYQYGLRPVQVCRMDLSDLRFYEGDDGKPIAHFTAYRAKKRNAADKAPFTSRVKTDWVPLFVEYLRRRKLGPVWQRCKGSEAKLFTLSKAAIVMAIGDVVEEITGSRSTATNLRHSAAQRMADDGASVEEVAEFLGHSQLDTCLVYFEASPAQAELVNKAMAMSPIYSKIAEVAVTGTIDKTSLLALPDDQQVGGMPHGIPISGIGACRLGQSLCAKNPVLSCYGCRTFIPVSDPDIHRHALAELRSVVSFFFDEARGGSQSPAYRQLTITLEAIRGVIGDVGGLAKETAE